MLPNQGLAHKTTAMTLLALPWCPMFKGYRTARVKRTLQQFNIKTAFKPYPHLLLSSKNRRTVHRKKKNSRHRLQG